MTAQYTKPERIDLKSRPEYDEKWVQKIIAEDPSVLGLGDLVLRDQERVQPRAGRLDLLLQDRETKRRFEVELQLGPTDESHIIRSIEYWDLERRRYPQYEHCAVLVAEQVTSRFLNVISLFNGAMPLIAIQMQAFAIGGHVTLLFTTVLDELTRGLVDEDEDAEAAPTDRAYWESRTSKAVVSLVDKLLDLIREFDQSVELKYNKFYIGLAKDGRAFNFVAFEPRKNHVLLYVRIPNTEESDDLIASANINMLDYHNRHYRLRIRKDDLTSKSDVIKDLMRKAHAKRTGS
ncbi:MAG: DUF5655 domain-containing protein [Bryobacterales bacterium]|nr:DUF5655 domain-containing protein [Bryobacterales bacterium]